MSFEARLNRIMDAVYGAIVESNAGKMVTIVAETTAHFPQMSERFNTEFMEEMQGIFDDFVLKGMEAGVFDRMDPMTLQHALFGLPVHLTLCRSMFTGTQLLDNRYDVDTVKAHHLTIMRKTLGLDKQGR